MFYRRVLDTRESNITEIEIVTIIMIMIMMIEMIIMFVMIMENLSKYFLGSSK